jgi:broad specificity phosphatase PhoE
MKNRTLYLLRHGKTVANTHQVNNPKDDSLTQQAIADARRARHWFAQQHFDHVYCSTLLRARQTLEAIGIPIERTVFDERIADIDTGAFAGKPLNSMRTYCAEHGLDYLSFTPPYGESHVAWSNRVNAFIESLPREGTVLVVAHGGVIERILEREAGYTDEYPENLKLWIVYSGVVRVENGEPWLER